MKNEFTLTLLLSNPFLDEVTLKRIEHIIKHSVNWYDVFFISLKQKTTFIICKHLLQYRYFFLIPDSLWMVWNAAYIGNIRKNQLLLKHYNLIAEELRKNFISATPTNGIMLITTVYADMIGIRILHDIDFLTGKKQMEDIDYILKCLDFQKIYVDDKDILMNPTNLYGNDTLYSKYVDSVYINSDFCSGINENEKLYNYLISAINSKNNIIAHTAHLLTLYISVEKSWTGEYLTSNIKQYTYARLIDLHLYKKMFVNSEILNILKQESESLYLMQLIQDVDNALAFFKKEGFLI